MGRAEGVGNYRNQGENQISRFEYLCFMLVKDDVVELKNIKNVMKNFDAIDSTGTGFIGLEDVQCSERSMGGISLELEATPETSQHGIPNQQSLPRDVLPTLLEADLPKTASL